jgi:hypothetical protein
MSRCVSLDIGLADEKTTQPYPVMSLAFDDDGYYWFCHPFFEELSERTGEMIDLYGGAWFAGPGLDELAATLSALEARVADAPKEWQVIVGYALAGDAPSKPLTSTVSRERLLGLLSRFQALVREARAGSKWIACLGD